MAINNSTYIVNDGGSTKNLRYGSTGNDVKQLQQQLQAAGYDVGSAGADGVYGSATANAVKQFQKDNGLAVDGIAGGNTKSALIKSATSASSSSSVPHLVLAADAAVTGAKIAAGTNPAPAATKTNNTATQPAATQTTTQQPAATTPAASTPAASTPATPTTEPAAKTQAQFTYDDFSYGDFSYGSYSQSETVQQAWALLQQQNAAKPGAYQSQWQDEINDYVNQIQNRDPFSYDFNSDALYQLYKNNYIQQGQMAMMDTMGQAAAMTGGYGNSYAQAVGQQAYNQQLNQLNNVIPDLYQMAFDRYAYEGQQLSDNLNMYMGLEDQDYGRYIDSMNAWQAERDYLAGRYDAESANDYNRWAADRELAYNQYTADRNLAYDQYNTGREQAWNEYVANQEKEMSAAELMASTGNYDRLGDVLGLTDEEVAAIKDANTPKATGGTTANKYSKISVGDTAYNTITSEIGRAENLDDLNNITSGYLALGYDPSQIKALAAGKIAELSSGTQLIDPPPIKEDEQPRRHVGTPGGGVAYYIN